MNELRKSSTSQLSVILPQKVVQLENREMWDYSQLQLFFHNRKAIPI